jgi:23S rRNA pseudouridine1911/1915/1917 synthase
MNEQIRTAGFTAQNDDIGNRIDRVIADRVPQLSRSRVKALIEEGRVSVDGQGIVNPSAKVRAGQKIRVDLPPPIDDRPEPQVIDLKVIYEDDQVIVIDKPAGMVVHPAPGNRDLTLVNALLAHCGDSLAGIGGVRRPGIVHRLDKDTSGIMVAAKTERAHAALSAAFAAHSIERAYQAVVWGIPVPREGDIDAPVGRSPANRKKMAVVANGKPAFTHYRVIRPLGLAASLVECRLRTGRTHQIRVHMTEIGHPLIGDPAYGRFGPTRRQALGPEGAAAVAGFSRQALHARVLGFDHPLTGERLRFESEFPADLALLVRSLESVKRGDDSAKES